MSFMPYDRPVRAAFVGLGRIYDLNVRAYLDNPDVEVVALVDPSEERRAQRRADWPAARPSPRSPSWPRAVSRSTPWRRCSDPAARRRGGRAPRVRMARQPAEADVQRPGCGATHDRRGHGQRPTAEGDGELHVLRATGEAEGGRGVGRARRRQRIPHEDGGERPRGLGRAGEQLRMAVPADAERARDPRLRRRVAQAGDGHLALRPDQGGAGMGRGTEVVPGVEIDAPTTIVWEHDNGVRGVWDITLATDMYLRSDYYTNDERWEVTGRRGFARVNRCTGRGIQQPSLEVYVDGEMRSYHALDDDWASSFRDSGRHWLRWLRTGEGPCCGVAPKRSMCCDSPWRRTRAASRWCRGGPRVSRVGGAGLARPADPPTRLRPSAPRSRPGSSPPASRRCPPARRDA